MSGRRLSLAAGAALCSIVACESEVTFHLLSSGDGSSASPGGGDASEAGGRGDANAGNRDGGGDSGDDGADSSSGDGEAGSVPGTPCRAIEPMMCDGGGDASCIGVTDAGCDSTIVWTQEPNGTPLGNPTGGVSFFDPCPYGSVLIGMHVGMGNWLNQVSAICRQVVLQVDTTQSGAPLSATLGARLDTPYAPAASTDTKNQVQDLLCPDGLVLFGIDGTLTTGTYLYVVGIGAACAPLVVTMLANAPVLDTDRAQQQRVGPIVCAGCATTQTYNFMTTIDPGSVATGLFGGDGLWVDRVGLGVSLASIRSQ
jgi:hypothetical protein